MSNILYQMVNHRAERTYLGPRIEASTYRFWVKHWFNTAAKIEEEFNQRGLYKTATAIRNIAVEQEKYCKEYLDNIE